MTSRSACRWRTSFLGSTTTDHPDEARSRFEAFASQDFADLPKDSYWLTTMALLADVGIMLEDRERTARLYDLLSPYAARNTAPGSGPVFFGAVSLYLG